MQSSKLHKTWVSSHCSQNTSWWSVISFLTCKLPVYLYHVASHPTLPAEHTQPQLGATQTVQGPPTALVGSLLQINPVLHHLPNMLERYNCLEIISSFLISKTVGNCRSSPMFLEAIVDLPGKTPGDTCWLLLSVLLTFYIKYYFIIMQIKSTLL